MLREGLSMVGGEGPTKNERSKQQNSKQQTPKSEAASAGRQPIAEYKAIVSLKPAVDDKGKLRQ